MQRDHTLLNGVQIVACTKPTLALKKDMFLSVWGPGILSAVRDATGRKFVLQDIRQQGMAVFLTHRYWAKLRQLSGGHGSIGGVPIHSR